MIQKKMLRRNQLDCTRKRWGITGVRVSRLRLLGDQTLERQTEKKNLFKKNDPAHPQSLWGINDDARRWGEKAIFRENHSGAVMSTKTTITHVVKRKIADGSWNPPDRLP